MADMRLDAEGLSAGEPRKKAVEEIEEPEFYPYFTKQGQHKEEDLKQFKGKRVILGISLGPSYYQSPQLEYYVNGVADAVLDGEGKGEVIVIIADSLKAYNLRNEGKADSVEAARALAAQEGKNYFNEHTALFSRKGLTIKFWEDLRAEYKESINYFTRVLLRGKRFRQLSEEPVDERAAKYITLHAPRRSNGDEGEQQARSLFKLTQKEIRKNCITYLAEESAVLIALSQSKEGSEDQESYFFYPTVLTDAMNYAIDTYANHPHVHNSKQQAGLQTRTLRLRTKEEQLEHIQQIENQRKLLVDRAQQKREKEEKFKKKDRSNEGPVAPVKKELKEKPVPKTPLSDLIATHGMRKRAQFLATSLPIPIPVVSSRADLSSNLDSSGSDSDDLENELSLYKCRYHEALERLVITKKSVVRTAIDSHTQERGHEILKRASPPRAVATARNFHG